ncbi:hypothetical protein Pelo_7185 [Pelomyxa schiedti]|nr:hypothetical protein Pelo_7185 [Pelomyxa schiedti]
MKSHCALLTNSNCFEIVSFCLVCFQCCSNPSSLDKCSLQLFESAYVLCLPGKLHYRFSDFGLWLLTTIANDPVVASPQNWSILLSCVFAFSWVESSYGLEIMTCSPFSNIGYGYPSTSAELLSVLLLIHNMATVAGLLALMYCWHVHISPIGPQSRFPKPNIQTPAPEVTEPSYLFVRATS